jgi:excisionase family DNA binding protein
MIMIQEITKDELLKTLEKYVAKAVASASEQIPPPDQLLTRKEAAEFLTISLATLHAYTKEGRIVGQRLGGRLVYRRSDLEKALKTTVK